MTGEEILRHVDHTLLKAYATWEDVKKLCEEALVFHTASVCVPPSYVRRIHETFGGQLNICTVTGFPLGYSVTQAKLEETQEALKDGAGEIDMVINMGDVKNGEYEKVKQEIQALRTVCGGHVLKVIVETCYLTEEEKLALCRIVTEAGADYIKTSTGFGTAGAALADVELFKRSIGPKVKIKAAGGIRTKEDMILFLRAGCDRIGTSAAAAVFGREPADRSAQASGKAGISE